MTQKAEENATNLMRFVREHVRTFGRPPSTSRNEFNEGEFAEWDVNNINGRMRLGTIPGIPKGTTYKIFMESLGFASDNPNPVVKIDVELTEENVKEAINEHTKVCLSPPRQAVGVVMFGELKQKAHWGTINAYIRRKLIPGLENFDSLDALTEAMGLEEPKIITPKVPIKPLVLTAQTLFNDLKSLRDDGADIPKPQKGVKLNGQYLAIEAGRAVQRGNVSNLEDFIDDTENFRPLCLRDFMLATGLAVQNIQTREVLWANRALD